MKRRLFRFARRTGDVFEGDFQAGPDAFHFGCRQQNVRATASAPGTVAGLENFGVCRDERSLLIGGQFDHGPVVVRIAERGENFSGHTEIGMIHVGRFDGTVKRQGDFSELVGCHGARMSVGKIGLMKITTRNVNEGLNSASLVHASGRLIATHE